jgi:hypothetical protein
MEQTAEGEPDSRLVSDMKELRAAIGLEEREGTSDEKSGP